MSREYQFMPNGVPRWIRCYDNDGKTADRYTVVFTRLHSANSTNRIGPEHSKRTSCLYLGMNGEPFHPQGICMHGESPESIDRPRYGHLGRKIRFEQLPGDCQKAVISTYRSIWRF